MLPIVADQLRAQVPQSGERRIAGVLAGHGGFMSLKMLAAHTGTAARDVDTALETLLAEGLVSTEIISPSGKVARLTPAGFAQDAEWRNDLDQACKTFAAPLDECEQQQLVDLLFKLNSPK